MVPKRVLQNFDVEYERRYAELEKKIDIQIKIQEIRDGVITKELSELTVGLTAIQKTLANGLMSRVSQVQERMDAVEKSIKTLSDGIQEREEKLKKNKLEFWQPIFRDFVRIGIIIAMVLVLERVPVIMAALGIRF